jgi:uncharacterized integral membrane protein (TIGR00698 family)
MNKNILNIIPGLFFTIVIAIAASYLGMKFPIIGASVFGIMIGIIVNNLITINKQIKPGINFSSKMILQVSIILLGGTLSVAQILKTGISSFFVMVFTISVALLTAFAIGKLLKIDSNLRKLIGVGTAICGGSAIAAISPIIKADEHDIAYSISTIFFFNVIAVIIFPPLGHILGLSDYGFGIFAGTAINDTSSVVAAGYTFSNAAGDFATIVKLTRTTMIIPISIMFMFFALISKKKDSDSVKLNMKRIFPWFIIGFIVMAIINSTGMINQNISAYIKESAKFLIVIALSAIGLKTDIKKMFESGFKPLFVGLITWIAVTVTSLAVQYYTGQI